MSSRCSLFTVLPSSLKAPCLLEQPPSKWLLAKLHKFFLLASWWPALENDGLPAWEFLHEKKMSTYHKHLQVLEASLVRSADKLYKSYTGLATHVDRPNVYRIQELVHYTILIFNQVSYVRKLVFESVHQHLKLFLSRDHTLNSYVYSATLILAKNCTLRNLQLLQLYNSEHETQMYRHLALVGLHCLFVGEEVQTNN